MRNAGHWQAITAPPIQRAASKRNTVKSTMKKSTVFLLLLTFVFVVVIMAGLLVTLAVFVLQGNTPNLLGSKRLALIRVEGLIYDARDWVDQVKQYQEDSSVKGIVLRVESPGGAIDPSQELYDALVEAQEEYGKVVVASFGSVAASGGYYVACNADKIVSSPGSLTGSIGVYSKFPVAKELMEKIGVAYETVKAGEYKDFGSMDRGLTDKEREMMQAVIDDSYDQFIEAVLKGRKGPFARLLNSWEEQPAYKYPFTPDMVEIARSYQETRKKELAAAAALVSFATPSIASATPMMASAGMDIASDTLNDTSANIVIKEATPAKPAEPTPDEKTLFAYAKSISEGKVYTGRQALKVGLVDKIGTLEDAIHLAAEMVGIRGEPTVIERKEKSYGLLDYLTESLSHITGVSQNHSPLQYRFPY